jgi:hypothetical protein
VDIILYNFDYLFLKMPHVSGSPRNSFNFQPRPLTGGYPAGSVAMAIEPSLSS